MLGDVGTYLMLFVRLGDVAATDSEKRAIAPNTLESDVPPLKAICSRPGMVNRACSTQQTQTSFSSTTGKRAMRVSDKLQVR